MILLKLKSIVFDNFILFLKRLYLSALFFMKKLTLIFICFLILPVTIALAEPCLDKILELAKETTEQHHADMEAQARQRVAHTQKPSLESTHDPSNPEPHPQDALFLRQGLFGKKAPRKEVPAPAVPAQAKTPTQETPIQTETPTPAVLQEVAPQAVSAQAEVPVTPSQQAPAQTIPQQQAIPEQQTPLQTVPQQQAPAQAVPQEEFQALAPPVPTPALGQYSNNVSSANYDSNNNYSSYLTPEPVVPAPTVSPTHSTNELPHEFWTFMQNPNNTFDSKKESVFYIIKNYPHLSFYYFETIVLYFSEAEQWQLMAEIKTWEHSNNLEEKNFLLALIASPSFQKFQSILNPQKELAEASWNVMQQPSVSASLTEAYPAQAQTEAYPAQAQTTAYPAQTQTEAHPAQAQTRAYPAQTQTEAYPAQTQTEAYSDKD